MRAVAERTTALRRLRAWVLTLPSYCAAIAQTFRLCVASGSLDAGKGLIQESQARKNREVLLQMFAVDHGRQHDLSGLPDRPLQCHAHPSGPPLNCPAHLLQRFDVAEFRGSIGLPTEHVKDVPMALPDNSTPERPMQALSSLSSSRKIKIGETHPGVTKQRVGPLREQLEQTLTATSKEKSNFAGLQAKA